MTDRNPVLAPLAKWIDSCTTNRVVSRSTVAMGIVVLDHLRRKCPLKPKEIQSDRGEIKGARTGLSAILERYRIRLNYLKEVTTRAGHQDGQRLFKAFGYGRKLAKIPVAERDAFLKAAIDSLVVRANEWLDRQHLKLRCDRQESPGAWIESVLREAKGRSGGKVEQHLVGAKLAQRHPDVDIPNNPGHAGDAQTGRPSDFVVGSTAYHVTTAPGSPVVEKCKANLGAGLHPVLVVPRERAERARNIADDHGVATRITVIGIEDLIALNIIEMSRGDQKAFVDVLKGIIDSYNQRLEAVETDLRSRAKISYRILPDRG